MPKIKINSDNVPSVESYIDNKLYDLTEKTNFKNMDIQQLRDFYDAHKKDYYVFESDNTEEIINSLPDEQKNLVITDTNEINEKKATRENLLKNYWETKLMYSMITSHFELGNRTLNSMLNMSLSDSAFERNEHFKSAVTGGNEKEKKRAIAWKFEEIGRNNLTDFDFSNDRDFAENYSKFFNFNIVCDLQNTTELADNYGLDLTEERFRDFSEKSNAMPVMWFTAKNRLAVISNPFYEYINLDKIRNQEEAIAFSDALTDIPTREEMLNTVAEETISLHANTSVFGGCRTLVNKTTNVAQKYNSVLQIQDTKRTAEQFREAQTFRDNIFNAMSNDEKLEAIGKGKYLKDTPDRLFSSTLNETYKDLGDAKADSLKAVDKELIAKIICTVNMQKKYNIDKLNGVSEEELGKRYSQNTLKAEARKLAASDSFSTYMQKGISEKDINELKFGYGDVPAKITDDFNKIDIQRTKLKNTDIKAYYKEVLEDNIKALKSTDESFEITKEEKEKIITDERIALHNKAKEFLEKLEAADKFNSEHTYGAIPEVFSRAMPYLMEKGDTPEIKRRNLELINDLSSNTFKGDARRKEVLIDTLNGINKIELLDPDVQDTDEKRLEKSMAQFDKCRLAYICNGDLQKTDSCGFALTSDAINKFKKNSKKLEEMSTEALAFIKTVASESYLTMPMDKISEHYRGQSVLFGQTVIKAQNTQPGGRVLTELILANELNDGRALSKRYKEHPIERNTFSLLDIKETKTPQEKLCYDLVDLRRICVAGYNTLANADHFYNFRNSKEYNTVLKTLEKAEFTFARQKDEIDEKNAPQIYKNLLSVRNSANAYVDKYTNKEMNKTRRQRYDTCCRLVSYIDKIITSDSEKNPENDYNLDPKFKKWIEQANETNKLKREGKFTEQRTSQMLSFAAKKTESLNKLKADFAEGSTERNALINLSLARDELTDMAKNNNMNAERKNYLFAAVFCCTPLIKKDVKPRGLNQQQLDIIISKTAQNPKFKAYTETLDSVETAKILGGYSDKKFEASCAKSLTNNKKPVAKPNEPQNDISINLG